MHDLTADQLRAAMTYDPATGTFRRLKPWRGRYTPGDVTVYGYQRINVGKHRYFAHRLAFLWMTGRWPEAQIDHKNGNRLDNRWCNLREATAQENRRNERKRGSNPYKGITFYKPTGRWKASIKVNRREKSLGYFTTPIEAHTAYARAARKYFGEFARVA